MENIALKNKIKLKLASKCAARAVTLCSTIQQTPNRTVTRASQACTATLPRTPAVNTAALPLSNISSSSSSVVAFPAEARRRGAQRQNSWGEHHRRPLRSFIWQGRGRDYRSLISSCLWMRPLLLSLKSTWASLYLVITSTNFLDSTACCAGKKRKKKI